MKQGQISSKVRTLWTNMAELYLSHHKGQLETKPLPSRENLKVKPKQICLVPSS